MKSILKWLGVTAFAITSIMGAQAATIDTAGNAGGYTLSFDTALNGSYSTTLVAGNITQNNVWVKDPVAWDPTQISSWLGVAGTDAANYQSNAVGYYKFSTTVTLGAGQSGSISGNVAADNSWVNFILNGNTVFGGAADPQIGFQSMTAFNLLGLTAGTNQLDVIVWNAPNDYGNATNPMGFLINGSTVNVVPLPTAAWLFGSALVGLAGIARRKKA